MKFRKSAKDMTGKTIDEGDILLYPKNGETIESVVIDVRQSGRDVVPQVHVKKIVKNWLGKMTGIATELLDVDVYRDARVVYPASLRDDVPSHRKVKEIREEVMEKVLSR